MQYSTQPAALTLERLESPLKISLDILQALQTNTNAQHPPIHHIIRHGAPLNQALHTTEAGRVLEQLQLAGQRLGHLFVLHPNGKHRAKSTRHLLAQPAVLVLGLGLQARVLDALDRRSRRGRRVGGLLGQPLDERRGCLALAHDAQLEGAQGADAQPALEAAEDGAEQHAVLQQRLPAVGHGLAEGQHAAQHVGVAAKVLCAAVHDNVGAVAKGVLQRRGRKGRVDGEDGAGAVRPVGVVLQVKGLAGRVERGLDVDHVAGLELVVEVNLLQARQAVVDVDDAVAPVVAAAHGDALRVEVHNHGVEGGQPRGVGEGAAAEDGREHRFEAVGVWVGVARVDVGVVWRSGLGEGFLLAGIVIGSLLLGGGKLTSVI